MFLMGRRQHFLGPYRTKLITYQQKPNYCSYRKIVTLCYLLKRNLYFHNLQALGQKYTKSIVNTKTYFVKLPIFKQCLKLKLFIALKLLQFMFLNLNAKSILLLNETGSGLHRISIYNTMSTNKKYHKNTLTQNAQPNKD